MSVAGRSYNGLVLADVRTVARWGPTGTPISVVVFDGDDTLWFTEPLYDSAREAALVVVEQAGLDGTVWEALQRSIDVRNVERFGHSPLRFPTSCVEAYEEVAGTGVGSADVARQIWDAAAVVFTTSAPPRADAHSVLSRLANCGVRLALLTKGDPDVQERRIQQSGLASAFEVVTIVPDKNPDSFRGVVEALKVDPSATASVGNSVHSDIRPALEAGLNAIWLSAHVWEFERQRDESIPDQVSVVQELAGVLTTLCLASR